MQLAQACGGDIKPTDTLAWLDIQGTPQEDRPWLAGLYSGMSAILRQHNRPSEEQ